MQVILSENGDAGFWAITLPGTKPMDKLCWHLDMGRYVKEKDAIIDDKVVFSYEIR
jgi:hypothetical protein